MAKKAKHNLNMIHHYCCYPHYSGSDFSGSSLIDATTLLLLLTIADERYQLLSKNGTREIKYNTHKKLNEKQTAKYKVLDESFDALLGDVEETITASYALSQAIDGFGFRPSDVIDSLCKKGYFVADWEEGSFYFATDEALPKAQKKLNKIEAGHAADARDF